MFNEPSACADIVKQHNTCVPVVTPYFMAGVVDTFFHYFSLAGQLQNLTVFKFRHATAQLSILFQVKHFLEKPKAAESSQFLFCKNYRREEELNANSYRTRKTTFQKTNALFLHK
jgi:hypothetical protein